eukprot:CAMPEP_0179188536 /NCGR_PEP_ID=MMETSP0796-20121207/93578_1 /TAXON_ID=73915 /ORGANISM="Pyrodinium bahamense, Strain pbaha01" /LENGTH=205 /DNA_ID=CAMNT_0020892645 /DNA_START=15 /DNA_END=628 /DNA_ORIENTATION=+
MVTTTTLLVNLGDVEKDRKLVLDIALIGVFLGVFSCIIAAGVCMWRRKQNKRELMEEMEEEKPGEIKEWVYKTEGETKGPFTNSQMREFFLAGTINRKTRAKVVWWTLDFRPLTVLFPQVGTEFTVPAAAAGDAHSGAWHRYVEGFFDDTILLCLAGVEPREFKPLRMHFPKLSEAFLTMPQGAPEFTAKLDRSSQGEPPPQTVG